MLNDRERELLELMMEQGGIVLEDGTEIYSSPQYVWKKLEDMREIGLVHKTKAPEKSKHQTVWTVSEYAKETLE